MPTINNNPTMIDMHRALAEKQAELDLLQVRYAAAIETSQELAELARRARERLERYLKQIKDAKPAIEYIADAWQAEQKHGGGFFWAMVALCQLTGADEDIDLIHELHEQYGIHPDDLANAGFDDAACEAALDYDNLESTMTADRRQDGLRRA